MKTLRIDLLALELDQCSRCGETLRNLERAVQAAAPALEAMGVATHVSRRVVASVADAEELRFACSPTIRIEGRDIPGVVSETPCDACSDLCGCSGEIACRVWPWQGEDHEAAPVGLLIEAIMREALGIGPQAGEAAWHGVPGNLKKYFVGREQKQVRTAPACCGPACCA